MTTLRFSGRTWAIVVAIALVFSSGIVAIGWAAYTIGVWAMS